MRKLILSALLSLAFCGCVSEDRYRHEVAARQKAEHRQMVLTTIAILLGVGVSVALVVGGACGSVAKRDAQ